MGKKIHVAISPITGDIYAGHILKDGMTWAANQQDVTLEALVAVAQHALMFKKDNGKDVIMSNKKGPKYKIIVEKLQ